MAKILTGAGMAAVGTDETRSTTQLMPLGYKVSDKDGNEFTYIKAGAAIAAYDACRFAGSALGFDDIRPTSAAAQTVVGVANAAFDSGAYGFIQSKGVCTAKVVVATAAGSSLVSNGTAGTLALAALVTGVAAGSGVVLL
jgi:hypothetical protein